VGELVEDDVADAGGVAERRGADPDRLVVVLVVDAPVAAVGRIEPDLEVDLRQSQPLVSAMRST
jgi:hypothetical protein